MKTKILILASNPQGTDQLRLSQEIRAIDEALERSRQREKFILRPKLAVRINDLQMQILIELVSKLSNCDLSLKKTPQMRSQLLVIRKLYMSFSMSFVRFSN